MAAAMSPLFILRQWFGPVLAAAALTVATYVLAATTCARAFEVVEITQKTLFAAGESLLSFRVLARIDGTVAYVRVKTDEDILITLVDPPPRDEIEAEATTDDTSSSDTTTTDTTYPPSRGRSSWLAEGWQTVVIQRATNDDLRRLKLEFSLEFESHDCNAMPIDYVYEFRIDKVDADADVP